MHGIYQHEAYRIILVGGFNPFEKYQSNGKSSPNRDENEKIFDTTTQYSIHVCKYTVRPHGSKVKAPPFFWVNPSPNRHLKPSEKKIVKMVWNHSQNLGVLLLVAEISAPVEVGSFIRLSHHLYGCFKHPKWCRISSIDGRMSGWK